MDQWRHYVCATGTLVIWYNQKFRLALVQALLVVSLVAIISWAFANVQRNLEVRDIQSGFEFLNQSAGFNIIMHLIPYEEASTYGRVFLVGLLNTLLVSAVGIVLATVLGFIVGLGRLSLNPLIRLLATSYIEVIRNIPLLLQIFFWYFAVLRALPHPRQSWQWLDSFFLNIRGLYVPDVLWSGTAFIMLGLLLCWLIAIAVASMIAKKIKASTGDSLALAKITFWVGLIILAGLCWVLAPVKGLNVPELKGFNFQGGIVLLPEFIALVLALTMYTAAFIAEIVRLGIQSVPHGQLEAAKALGLNRRQTLKLVVIPQALKVILPPLTNQYLNLTKNSSLAAAIAYPDLVSVFAGTVLNQTGQAIEVIGMTMAVYLTISLSISLVMISYEKAHHWGRT